MKRLFTLLLLTASFYAAQAQCTTCTPDPSFFPPNPASTDLGLSTDTVYVTQAVPLDTTIHALLPRQFNVGGLTVNVSSIDILSVSGFPSGLTWTCDATGGQSGCSYNPSSYRYACVQACGTTFSSPGTYPVSVNVRGTAVGQSQGLTIPITVIVQGAPGGNAGYSFTPVSGCEPLTVDFESNIPIPGTNLTLQPYEYFWDLGNSQTATGKIVNSVVYPSAGNYVSELTIVEFQQQLNEVNVTSNSGNWFFQESICDGIGIPGLGFSKLSDSDLYFEFTQGGTFRSSTKTDQLRPSWGNLGIPVTQTSLFFSMSDEDCAGNADDLAGNSAFTFTGPGVVTFNYGTGVQVQLTFITVPIDTLVFTDTINVFGKPGLPFVTANKSDTICVGETITLTSTLADSYQWFENDTTILSGETNRTLVVSSSGAFSVQIRDTTNFCPNLSTPFTVTSTPAPPAPFLTYDGTTGTLQVGNAGSFDIQWFLDGQPLVGANSSTLTSLPTAGPYTVTLTSPVGCSSTSAPFTLCIAGEATALSSNSVDCCNSKVISAESQGFSIKGGTIVAWAVSPLADGLLDNDAAVQTASANDLIFLSDSTGGILISPCDLGLTDGDYYLTPFVAEAPVVEPIVWDTVQGCAPFAEICPVLSGTDWIINPLLFTFPNGQTVDVLDFFGLPSGTEITPSLIQLLGGLPCIPLTSLYEGDPNGTWSIAATNTGTGSLTVTIPAFQVIVESDTCPLLTQDQVVDIDGINITIAPGGSQGLDLEIPPLPAGFPTVDPGCAGYGTPVSFNFNDCPDGIENIQAFNNVVVYPNPNQGTFTVTGDMQIGEVVNVAVNDILGRTLYTESLNSNGAIGSFEQQIDITGADAGIYFVTLTSEASRTTLKLIVR